MGEVAWRGEVQVAPVIPARRGGLGAGHCLGTTHIVLVPVTSPRGTALLTVRRQCLAQWKPAPGQPTYRGPPLCHPAALGHAPLSCVLTAVIFFFSSPFKPEDNIKSFFRGECQGESWDSLKQLMPSC